MEGKEERKDEGKTLKMMEREEEKETNEQT